MTKLKTLPNKPLSFLDKNPDYVWSSSRKRIYLGNPKPIDFDIEAIAKGLSKVCRFNAQCKCFYSVATHSVIVSRLCPPTLKLHGLLHDASEAYIHDLTKPLKNYLKMSEAYKPIETRFMTAIAQKFGFIYTEQTYLAVKEIERPVILAEIRDLMDLPEDESIDFSEALAQDLFKEILPKEAQETFLQEYSKIITEFTDIPF